MAMFVFAPRVADTITKIVKIESQDISYIYVILIALISAIVWDQFAWRLGLPTSSLQALIGTLEGTGIAFGGGEALYWEKIIEIGAFIFLAPLIGFIFAFIFMCLVYTLPQLVSGNGQHVF